MQRAAGGAQRHREVAHRGQKQRDARFARPDVGGLFGHLGHPHRVLRGVEAVEGGGVQIELVAQHEHQGAQLQPRAVRAVRQASEQNLTSSQLRAQRLRQLMARPQATQGLLGKACLLPLKDAVAGFIVKCPRPQRVTACGPGVQRPRCS